MANAFGRALGPAQDALSQPTGTTPQMSGAPAPAAQQQMDGTPVINPGVKPTNPGQKIFKNVHSPHGSSGFEKVAGALADKLHKTRGR